MPRQYSSLLDHCQLSGTRSVYKWLDRLVARAFPPACVLCLDPGQPPALDLCSGCEQDLPWLARPCPGCALPSGAGQRCAACERHPLPFDAAFAPLAYDFPVDHLVRGLKYHRDLAAGRVLGTLLGQRAGARNGAVQALLPVPLHRRREADRGYNQAAELARHAGGMLDLPVVDDLVLRRHPTAEQAGLDADARRRNLAGAFAVHGVLRHRRYAIVDDVMTTGSTMAELAIALRAAGAEYVEAWAVARALPHAGAQDQRNR